MVSVWMLMIKFTPPDTFWCEGEDFFNEPIGVWVGGPSNEHPGLS